MKILSFDPSGNFREGKGTTGWSLHYQNDIKTVGQIRAIDYNSQIEYWKKHLELIDLLEPDVLVVEEYKLYSSAATAQIGSEFETVQLIGIIKKYCSDIGLKIVFQPARIKIRYSNKILLKKNIITQDAHKRYYVTGVPITGHILDAIRHGEFYINFTSKKGQK